GEAFGGGARLVEGLRAGFGESDPGTVLEAVIDVVGYEQYLAEEGAEGIERLDNVRELVAGAAEWAEEAATDGDEAGEEGRGEGTTLLQRYLTQVALVTPADDRGSGAPNGVTLITVHLATGLEWPVVALAGLEDGLFPLGRAAGEPGGREEERRPCYVGLTWALEQVYVSWG